MVGQFKKYTVLFLLLIVGNNTIAQEYLKIRAKKGDGISVLLNRYNLAAHSCNIDTFLTINKLNRTDQLQLAKAYKMPISRNNDDEIVYNYKLEPGVSDQFIALELLKSKGFDKDLVDRAMNICDSLSEKETIVEEVVVVEEDEDEEVEEVAEEVEEEVEEVDEDEDEEEVAEVEDKVEDSIIKKKRKYVKKKKDVENTENK